ncbi:Rha family transcriptional regulator [Escherichia coli]
MNYPTIVNGIDFRDLVFVTGNEPVTDTRKVAVAFGKEHKDVLRKTRAVVQQCSKEFAERNFALCYENNELQNGKPQPIYRMTKDGWTMLVFGFTGKAAVDSICQCNTPFNYLFRCFELQCLSRSVV